MRSDTQTVSIKAASSAVFQFLADVRNLPRWATGFAKSVRQEGTRWVVLTGSGEMAIRISSHEETGVVDYFFSPAPGVEALAASRVIATPVGAEYTFTQFQAPGMPDSAFEQSVTALRHELQVLKKALEK